MKQTLDFKAIAPLEKFTRKFGVVALLNRSLPTQTRISLSVGWGLALLPIAIFNQVFAPHPIWMVLVVVLAGLYGLGYFWIRSQATGVKLARRRVGPVLVAGDRLQEEFELTNTSRLPLLWAEVVDHSEIPNYQPGRVVAAGGESSYRWNSGIECRRRGIFRVGPHMLLFGDPFGLFRATITYDYSDIVIIYPRVVEMPPLELPLGNASGANRRRRPLVGPYPAASVTDYRPGDSLRYIHWPMTAHRGRLTVKELEIEPSGDVWIVLDLNRAVHAGGDDEDGTFEFSIIMAASLAAELLTGAERRAVGLLTTSGKRVTDSINLDGVEGSNTFEVDESLTITVSPQTGSAQLWNILGTLASVEAADISLVQLLRGSRELLGRRRTIYVITPDLHGIEQSAEQIEPVSSAPNRMRLIDGRPNADDGPDYATEDWVAELLHLKSGGLASSAMLVEPAHDRARPVARKPDNGSEEREDSADGERVQTMLIGQEIPTRIVRAGLGLRTVITFRRTRQVIRSTPTGGVVTYNVDEEVG